MTGVSEDISVLCVDDNEHVARALRMKLGATGGFEWKGWLPSADDLVDAAVRDKPSVVLLDIDMPGRDPFSALEELAQTCPQTRVIVFSGHLRKDLIDRAVVSGAWGYVSKNDGENALIWAIRRVAGGEFALSPEVRSSYDRF